MIETVDEWNNATFPDAFNECFSDEPQNVSDAIWQLIQDMPGHKALACKAFDYNTLIFIKRVFVSSNDWIVDHALNPFVVGINRFNAFAKTDIGNFSQQYSHSERAVGVFLFRNQELNDNARLLIKNQLPTCINCQRFLLGRAAIISVGHLGMLENNIMFLPINMAIALNAIGFNNVQLVMSVHILRAGLQTTVTVDNRAEATYTCN